MVHNLILHWSKLGRYLTENYFRHSFDNQLESESRVQTELCEEHVENKELDEILDWINSETVEFWCVHDLWCQSVTRWLSEAWEPSIVPEFSNDSIKAKMLKMLTLALKSQLALTVNIGLKDLDILTSQRNFSNI